MQLSTMCHLLWWTGRGGNFYSLFGPKNTNLVEDVKILLPFSSFRGKVKICLSKSEARAAIFFWISPKNTNLVESVESLLPIKFRWIRFSSFKGEVENVSANQRPGRSSCFSDWPAKNLSLVESVKILLPVKFRWILFSGFYREFENVSANQRPGGHLVFPIGPKNTNLVEGFEILLPIKFRWIWGEVENVSANQRPWRPSCFSDGLKHKLGRGLWDLPVKFRWIPFSCFRGEVIICLSQSEARTAILFFRSAQKTQTW